MSATTASIEVLKHSLEANGLPTGGTKVELLQRLIQNKGDGRKSDSKVKVGTKMPAMTSTQESSSVFEAFTESERATLIASGITEEDVSTKRSTVAGPSFRVSSQQLPSQPRLRRTPGSWSLSSTRGSSRSWI